MASGLNGVQAKVKEKIPQALFIHCYAHALNLVLSQGVAKIRECKIFFSHLSGLAAFFSSSPKRMQLLEEICQKRLPGVAATRWNFASRLVCTVFERKDVLKDLFDYIVDHHDEFEDTAIHSADGFISNLRDFEFCFLLSSFSEMFARADVLFDILQNKSFDVQFCVARVDEFCICIEGQRERFDQIYDETVQNTGVPTGRKAHGDSRSHYRKLHDDILDNILNQVQNRFEDHKKLSFLSLLDPQQFTSFKTTFPETAFSSLTDSYGPHFDLPRLKTELSVMYSMVAFQGKSPSDLLLFLQRKGLCDSMYQLYALTCLVLTIPVTTASVERAFSALRRIKTYVRNTTGRSQLSALASIAIEKQVLMDLKTSDQLYDRVIEKFIQKDRRMDFVFIESCFSLGQQEDFSGTGDGEPKPEGREDSPVQPGIDREESADMEEGRTESLLIKEERLEEDSDPQGEMKIREERAVESRAGGGERTPIQDTQNKAAQHTEELTEQHRTRHSAWESADAEEKKPESLLIKEERPVEFLGNSDPQTELNCREETFLHAVMQPGAGGETAPFACTQSTPNEADRPPGTTHGVWERSGLENVLKAEPENNSVNKTLQHRGSEHRAGRLNSLGSESVMCERTSHLGTCFTQGRANTETEDPSCSYVTGMEAEGLLFHPEQLVSTSGEGVVNSMSSIDLKSKPVKNSVPIKVAAGVHSFLNKRATSKVAHAKYQLYREAREREKMQPEHVAKLYPAHTKLTARENTANAKSGATSANGYTSCDSFRAAKSHCRAGTRDRLCICTYCGKNFNRPRSLEMHLRVHTGEKPFSCTQCGKSFSQLCSLKTHQSVHTGERPFRCAQCGKRFAQPGYLKRHQTVHTGERPFKCTQCEKSFSFLSNLIRHQSLHASGKRSTSKL
ncbi:uncharacterized protein si:ch211-89o9.6 isoform X2 [Megalops cyprinoides]|uniref:uncharacterized protein si:ch211-89o9.6 isoform X2 n=1 Tax=Megalops cyprinoides TaxID=118141 RepID=UPI001864E3F5|nr:uncharacterized protein si:ch211-89o9.6 isoform X2 [Megalops cyprinoides]